MRPIIPPEDTTDESREDNVIVVAAVEVMNIPTEDAKRRLHSKQRGRGRMNDLVAVAAAAAATTAAVSVLFYLLFLMKMIMHDDKR